MRLSLVVSMIFNIDSSRSSRIFRSIIRFDEKYVCSKKWGWGGAHVTLTWSPCTRTFPAHHQSFITQICWGTWYTIQTAWEEFLALLWALSTPHPYSVVGSTRSWNFGSQLHWIISSYRSHWDANSLWRFSYRLEISHKFASFVECRILCTVEY